MGQSQTRAGRTPSTSCGEHVAKARKIIVQFQIQVPCALRWTAVVNCDRDRRKDKGWQPARGPGPGQHGPATRGEPMSSPSDTVTSMQAATHKHTTNAAAAAADTSLHAAPATQLQHTHLTIS